MTVYLVGAGPGDPGLLTVRGAEILARADVVVHDRLADASLLHLAPPGAERIDVGKTPGAPVAQDEINALLVRRGLSGGCVVRLKGGDPFVFGRGGEEALALTEAGVDWEVVPGVTAAVAAPAYAGVPVTHRGLATAFTVVTGHGGTGVDTETDWAALARSGGTIVVLMGVAQRGAIAERLVGAGLPASTPVAAVTWGTRPEQSAVRTTLGALASAPVSPPATIVIGEVASLRLDWYTRRPLFGRRVVVTRTRAQASALSARLRDLGARPVEVPVIDVAPPDDGGAGLRRAAADLSAGRYRWVLFTSANAVAAFCELLPDARAFAGAGVAAIGPGTAQALARFRIVPDLVPREALAEALLASLLAAEPDRGIRALLPRAAVARPVLPEGLRAAGWDLDEVEAYRTVVPTLPAGAAEAVAGADAICFTSASTVDNWLALAAPAGLALPPVVACIGPVTAARARDCGMTVTVEAAEHTLDGLVAALAGALTGAFGR